MMAATSPHGAWATAVRALPADDVSIADEVSGSLVMHLSVLVGGLGRLGWNCREDLKKLTTERSCAPERTLEAFPPAPRFVEVDGRATLALYWQREKFITFAVVHEGFLVGALSHTNDGTSNHDPSALSLIRTNDGA